MGHPICATPSGKLPSVPFVLTRNSRLIMNADALMVSIVTSFLVLSRAVCSIVSLSFSRRIGLTKFATSLLMFGFCYKLVLDSS